MYARWWPTENPLQHQRARGWRNGARGWGVVWAERQWGHRDWGPLLASRGATTYEESGCWSTGWPQRCGYVSVGSRSLRYVAWLTADWHRFTAVWVVRVWTIHNWASSIICQSCMGNAYWTESTRIVTATGTDWAQKRITEREHAEDLGRVDLLDIAVWDLYRIKMWFYIQIMAWHVWEPLTRETKARADGI